MRDFAIEDHGTVWTFVAVSQEAKNFVKNELDLEPWQQIASNRFAVDHRPARTLACVLQGQGFEVS